MVDPTPRNAGCGALVPGGALGCQRRDAIEGRDAGVDRTGGRGHPVS